MVPPGRSRKAALLCRAGREAQALNSSIRHSPASPNVPQKRCCLCARGHHQAYLCHKADRLRFAQETDGTALVGGPALTSLRDSACRFLTTLGLSWLATNPACSADPCLCVLGRGPWAAPCSLQGLQTCWETQVPEGGDTVAGQQARVTWHPHSGSLLSVWGPRKTPVLLT